MLTDGDEDIVSPSQLVIPECVESNPDLDLGMADWLSDSTVLAPPPPKRLRLTFAHSPLRVSIKQQRLSILQPRELTRMSEGC